MCIVHFAPQDVSLSKQKGEPTQCCHFVQRASNFDNFDAEDLESGACPLRILYSALAHFIHGLQRLRVRVRVKRLKLREILERGCKSVSSYQIRVMSDI